MGWKLSRAARGDEIDGTGSDSAAPDTGSLEAVSSALRDSIERTQRRHAAAMDATPHGMAVLGADGTIIYLNAACAKIHGYDAPDELIGASWRTLFPAAEVERHEAEDRPILLETGQWKGEMTGRRRDGAAIDLEVSLALIDPDEVVCTCRDITERKLEERSRTGRDEAFRQLTEHIHEVFWLTDMADSRVLYVSPMYETVWGRSAEHLYANPHAWTDAIHPEDRARVSEAWERNAERGEFDEVYRIARPDGTVRWIRDRGFPIRNPNGDVYRLAGLAEDITERRRVVEALRLSDEQLRSITESSTDFIMLLDTEARIVFINRTMADLSPAEVIGTGICDWVSPRFWPEMNACFERVLATAEPGTYSVEYDSTDGAVLTFESRVGPIVRDGQVTALVVNSRDITDRLRLEAEIRDSHARLERLTERLHAIREEERAGIAREIHDQLGQALTGLRLDMAWLRDRVAPDDEEASRRASRSLSLIDRTLDSVRDLSIRLRPTSLDDLGLDAAVEAYVRDSCVRSGIEYSIHGGVDGRPIARECATATYRVLQESITNVLRHARARRVDVRLTSSGGTLLMEVRDDGVGITPEQVSNRDSVGLTGMRERARACGGRLTVDRLPHGGTSVALRIPLLESPGV